MAALHGVAGTHVCGDCPSVLPPLRHTACSLSIDDHMCVCFLAEIVRHHFLMLPLQVGDKVEGERRNAGEWCLGIVKQVSL